MKTAGNAEAVRFLPPELDHIVWRAPMSVSYKKLWKILIDKDMSKTQLCKEAKISTNAMAKMGKGEDVRVETLIKVCRVLKCKIDDIIDYDEKI